MATKLSLVNLVASAAAVTGSTAQAAYPATNVKTPERPFMPWKTTVATASDVVIDFGATKTLDAVALSNVNFTSATIQGNATNSWTAPSYTQSITIARNRWNTRYQHGHQIVGSFSYRYLRISIGTQTPVDGSSGFSIGGIHAGVNVTMPRGIRADYSMIPHEPGQDVGPEGDAWSQHTILGDIWTSIQGRLTLLTGRVPAHNDYLSDWLDILRQMPKSTPVLLALEGVEDPAQSFIVRRINDPQWRVSTGTFSEADIEWREAT
jgi:hypothetical protein